MTTRNKFTWIRPASVQIPAALLDAVQGNPLLAEILLRRGISSPNAARAFLRAEDYSPALPEELPDLDKAAQILGDAISRGERILVWGDFDVDGQTATAALLNALTSLGADAVFYIPDRLRESHGIKVEFLEQQLATFCPSVLLTCDTGVSAFVAIDYAKSRGVHTIITDHHDLPPELPPANAVVNPKRLPPDHPLSGLPGVGVVYKLIEYLFRQYARSHELPRFLDLVALGIVADVAPQTHDTRYLLQLGIRELQNTVRIGLHALAAVANLDLATLTVNDIAFQLAPRLNAAGRLSSAALAVELLTTSHPADAHLLATQLEGLNTRRKLLNQQIFTAAQEQIARDPSLLNWTALVIEHPAWHPGIIGIVANQLAERYQRPVVLLAVDEDGVARGSARSSSGYDIGAAIAAQADLLLHFGGHPGAAGLSLLADNIPAFRRRLSNTLAESGVSTANPSLAIDAEVSLGAVTAELVLDLYRLGPFGEGNPPITLTSPNLTLRSTSHFGPNRQHRRLIVEDESGARQTVIWWDGANEPLPDGLFDLAFNVDFYSIDGRSEPQLTLVDYRRSAAAPITIEAPQKEIIDLRSSLDPRAALAHAVQKYPGAAIWAEGFRLSESPGLPLASLPQADTLIVYTSPPGPQRLIEAIERVQPATVVLIGADPPLKTAPEVHRRILELVKYIVNRQGGRTTLDALASAVGCSLETARRALEFSEATGDLALLWERDDTVLISPINDAVHHNTYDQRAALETSMSESAAYRAYFRRAAPHHLLGWEI